jgi:hypothetical protein
MPAVHGGHFDSSCDIPHPALERLDKPTAGTRAEIALSQMTKTVIAEYEGCPLQKSSQIITVKAHLGRCQLNN